MKSERPKHSAASFLLTVQSALIAETVTFPLDITKTRLQLQNELKSSPSSKRGMITTAIGIFREEGLLGLYQGVPPALLRHVVYSGIRIGCYEQIRDHYSSDFSLWKKALAGATSGAIGQFFASPTDLVKVRLQSQRRMGATGTKYKGTLDAFKTIVHNEGFFGLWKGVIPNVQRAAIVNLGELATYDQSKELLVSTNYFTKEGVTTHTIASIMSGFVASVVSCPVDVIKTRMMNQQNAVYKSSLDCLVKTVKAEGGFALYKGFLPTWTRLGPWQFTFWVTYEQLRKISGLGGF